MAASKRTVTAPLVTVRFKDGSVHYLGDGDVLPDDASKESIKLLADLGYLSKSKSDSSTDADDDDDSDDDGYESQTVAELKAEVDRRNDGGAEIEVGGNGNKADLIEALEADDDK